MNKIFSAYTPTHLIFGSGSFQELKNQILPGKKAMVLLGGKSLKKSGIYSRIQEQLIPLGIDCILFDQFMPNPVKELVENGGQFAREHHADFLIAVGGGSAIDAAKAIAVCAKNEKDLWTFVHDGTGSEMDGGCVITKTETKEKNGLNDIRLFPAIAIVDPELMITVPPTLTAYQGFDALFHATELYVQGRPTMSVLFSAQSKKGLQNAAQRLGGFDHHDLHSIASLSSQNRLIQSLPRQPRTAPRPSVNRLAGWSRTASPPRQRTAVYSVFLFSSCVKTAASLP